MEMNNSFEVGCPIDEAWNVLTDVERIAPCLPGARLTGAEGSKFQGLVKVRVGPITAQYRGTAEFAERDDDAHRAVIIAKGRDTRGAGNASATITAQLEEVDAGSTRVNVITKLTITGKVAQFGRGVMADVSARLMDKFVDNLAELIAASGQSESDAADTGDSDAAEAGDSDAGDAGSSAAAGSGSSGSGSGASGSDTGASGSDTGASGSDTGASGSDTGASAAGDRDDGAEGAATPESAGEDSKPAAIDAASSATPQGQIPNTARPNLTSQDDDVEAIDLLGVAGDVVTKRLKKAVTVGAALLSLLVVRRMFRRITGRSRSA